MHNLGFTNVTLLDISEESKKLFLTRVPGFNNFKVEEFFELEGEFDYIIEHTFFCALNPTLRERYAQKMQTLLAPKGKLMGLMFEAKLYKDHPPFGGNKSEYLKTFTPYFSSIKMNITSESIEERMGRELFIELSNK